MTSKKRVFLGSIKGETPRKEFYFMRDDAPNSVNSATPDKAQLAVPLKSSLSTKSVVASPPVNTTTTPEKAGGSFPTRLPERPTTSRGKAHPSPDEFASYISSSPPKAYESDKRMVLSFNNNSHAADRESAVFDDSSDDDDDSGIVFAEWRRDEDEDEEEEEEENAPKEVSEGLGGTLSVEQLNALRGCWLFGVALSV